MIPMTLVDGLLWGEATCFEREHNGWTSALDTAQGVRLGCECAGLLSFTEISRRSLSAESERKDRMKQCN